MPTENPFYRRTSIRNIREILVNKSEILTLIVGFLLMFAGALVESRSSPDNCHEKPEGKEDKMMKIPLEEYIPYHLLALFIMAVFYGIYLVKQWVQKRRGIQTIQFGRGKEAQAHTVETLMGIATVGLIPAQLLSIGFGWSHLPAGARFTGFCVAILGDLIFLISVLCMKDSWRAGIPDKDRTELVTDGIYRYSRNPAFLGFDLQYIGVLLMFCNLLTAAFTAFAITMLHLQILQEERYLTTAFGTEYLAYRRRVLRYLGRVK